MNALARLPARASCPCRSPPDTRCRRSPAEPVRVAPLVPAVARALTLLERLARGREPMTLARLASELALPKSSVHGLCTTLVSFGYLRRQADGSFLIGPRVMGLAEAFVAGTDVAQEFNALWSTRPRRRRKRPSCSRCSREPRRSTSACATAPARSGLAFNVGMRLPAYLSGSGKAMLAQLAARGGAAPLRRPALDAPDEQGAARPRVAAEGAGADQKARLQHRRRGGPRRRLFVRRPGVRRLRRGGRRRSPSASTRSSSAATAARAIATPCSTSRTG